MPLANVGLRFDTGLTVGRWDIPNPSTKPKEFLAVANDIGYHVALEISRGAMGCFFINMGELPFATGSVEVVHKRPPG